MYTGIVTQRARVEGVRPAASDASTVRLDLRLEREVPDLRVGDSVALDGCCLTAVAVEGTRLSFDAIPETLRKSTLGDRRRGDVVNVETPLRAGDALGGHLVQGHVDGAGTVSSVERRGDDVRLVVSLPEALTGATVPKGSVAVDGVSLTVGECGDGWFSVYLIPHTLAVTGLGVKRPGDRVNLEADVIGRYVEHHVRRVLGRGGAGATQEAVR
jgi:riboflavin synthase